MYQICCSLPEQANRFEATELTENVSQAEVVVTDKEIECAEGASVIREYDIEKMIALMNR